MGQIRVIQQRRVPPRRAARHSLRSPTFRQTPNALYNVSGLWPISTALVLDTRYEPDVDTNQALFLQRENIPMVFVVPMAPVPGSTNVNRNEEMRAHLIKAYTATADVKAFVNGVERPVTITSTTGGIFAVVPSGAGEYAPAEDGLVHLRIEGLEDDAGPVFAEWTFEVKPRQQLVQGAAGKLSIAMALIAAVAARVPIPTPSIQGAAARVPVREIGQTTGEAAGRIFVGELFFFADASGTVNIAEVFREAEGSGTVTIEGFALETGASGTLEILGATINFEASGAVNLYAKIVEAHGSGTLNLGNLAQDTHASGTAEVWGEQSGHNYGRLLIRVTPISPEMVQELVQAGVRFGYEAVLVSARATVSIEETLS